MKTKRIFAILLAIALLLPAIFSYSQVQASYPSFTISKVKMDETVTLLTRDMPKDYDFKVLLGEYNTRGVDGIEVALFDSGSGGSFEVTVDIPAALKGRAMISVRIESLTGGYYYYNWFWNDKDNGTWPGGKPPVPTQPPAAVVYPTFSIKAVDAGSTVTILAKDFPKNHQWVVRMGKNGTRGIGGIVAAEVTSSDTGSFEATFTIPAELASENIIAIRLDAKTGGWYAYNWFYNKSYTPPVTEPTPAPTPSPAVKYPTFSIAAVEKEKNVTVSGINFPANTEFTVLMGKMWTQGINGITVAEFNTGTGGSITATFDIPAELTGLDRIAIRLQAKTGGWFAYNWFWNSTANK
ncbi:MAG: hypothetical protein M0P11_00485 [Anaerolineaceae bacterium]|nr:hypothetical protein [Anaerolineaceae bacterium]